MRTLPIVIGRERASKVLFVFTLVPLAIIIYYINTTLYKQPIVVAYFLIFIVAPLIFICIKILAAKTRKEFHTISNLFKFVMLFGILSLLLYKFIILN